MENTENQPTLQLQIAGTVPLKDATEDEPGIVMVLLPGGDIRWALAPKDEAIKPDEVLPPPPPPGV